MEKIELEIIALSHSITQSHSYAVVLGEKKGSRRLPIVIGGFEAQSIAIAIENIEPSRPLTHDLMKNVFKVFNINLQEIVINNLINGVFYAQLICEKDGQLYEIDSRTSDAIALAARFDCPIFTYEFILETAGIILDEKELKEEEEALTVKEEKEKKIPKKDSLQELKKALKKALENENYEEAAKIRDEINKLSQN
jgi:uncharacterized protein